MSRTWIAFALGVALSSVACVEGAPESATAMRPPVAPSTATIATVPNAIPFDKFVDDFFDAEFAWSPSFATGAGIHGYDNKMEDRSQVRISARVAELHALATRLDAYPDATLSFDDQIDKQMLATRIAGELLDLETIKTWNHNPASYIFLTGRAIDGLIKRNFAPPGERLRSVIARLRALPAVYAAARANLDDPPREFTDMAMRMARGSVAFFDKALPVWARAAAGDDPALLADFNAANAAALEAARGYATFLEKDLLPRSKGNFALGAALFSAKLRADEMIDTPLPELLSIGEAQLAKDYDAAVEIAKTIDPGHSVGQVFDKLSDTHFAEADLIASVAKSLEEVRAFVVAKDLITIPSEVRPHVEETPGYSRFGGFASMDTPGAFEDKATEAFYYVTPPEKDWDAKHKEEHLRLFTPPVVAMIDIHEVFPGHYVQFLFKNHVATKTRKLLGCSSNSEGWAHYAEQMVVEQGFGNGDPRIKLAQRAEALVRDCRYLSAINLHTSKWTLEQATKCFEDKAFMSHANAFEEARRGTINPTYLYYTAGKLAIIKLRDEYLQKTGGTLKQFHDAFVGLGTLPIPLTRKLLLK